ncbi:MAG: hypothetical protein KF789_08710 [Bdellovibrionaceae bacterium]|nr:hypothetical protein [Pseudobdellovibrionaceae bacterium]
MRTLFQITLVCLAFALASQARAASVSQVKDRKALLDLTGLLDVKPGDQLFAVDGNGKRKALLQIRQVKGNKAVAEVIKGSAVVGQDLMTRGGTSSAPSISKPVVEDTPPSSPLSDRLQRTRQKKSGPAWGLLGHYNQTNMDVSFFTGQGVLRRKSTSQMKGSAFGLSGFYDYLFTPRFQMRSIAGLDQVSASGTTALPDCDKGTTSNCTFAVTYLTLAAQARFILNEGNTKFWLGGGGGFLLAMQKSSNVLDTSQISTNQVYFLSGGADIGLSGNKFIPISLDYGMFPSSETVKANIMTLRAGYGWFF